MQSSDQTWAAFRQADARPPPAAKSDPPRCGKSPGGAGGQTIRHTMSPRGRTGPRGRRGHLPCRRAAREGRGPACAHAMGAASSRAKYGAARAPRPPRGRHKKQKTKKKTPATRNYGRAVRRPCTGLSRGRAAGGSKCRRRPLGRRGLFPALVGSLRCRALPGPSSCRTNYSVPVGIAAWIFAPLLQAPSIFLSEAMLGPRAGGHMQPASAACAASVHSQSLE